METASFIVSTIFSYCPESIQSIPFRPWCLVTLLEGRERETIRQRAAGTGRFDSRQRISGAGSGGDAGSDLRMAPELMLDLARQAAELLVNRIEGLPEQGAWDGDFQKELEARLLEDPPEEGRPPADVIERAAREVLPFATRLDHPRCFAFVPSAPTWPGVLADFIAAGYNFNACTWLVASGPSQLELVVLEWFRRWLGYPEGAGGLLTSGGSAAALNAFVAARESAGNPERRPCT